MKTKHASHLRFYHSQWFIYAIGLTVILLQLRAFL